MDGTSVFRQDSSMSEVETSSVSANWSRALHEQADALLGLASTSSSKYDNFKRWLTEELEVVPSVCYLSDLQKQWTARVGQAFMGLPSLLVLLIEGEPQKDAVRRLEKLHGYATGLEATLLFFGREGAWQLDAVVGLPGKHAFDLVRGVMRESTTRTASQHPRVSRPGGTFFDLEPESQAEIAWNHLVGRGSLPVPEAIALAAKELRAVGLLDYARLRTDGLVYSELESAISYASRRGFLFDRPQRGHVRAIKSDADEFTRDDWRECLLNVLSDDWIERDDAIRNAATLAVDVFGLNMVRLRSGGRIDSALRSALNGLIRINEVDREGPSLIRLARSRPSTHAPSAGTEEVSVAEQAPDPTAAVSTSTDSVVQRSSPADLRRLIGHLPAEAEASIARLLAAPGRPVDELRTAVASHLQEFERAFAEREFLDMGGAALLARQAEELLRAWNDLTPDQRIVAQAAIEYFVESNEGDDDFVLDGLRTDKAVMAAAIDSLL